MTAEDLTALNEQIAAMARAGLPLDQGLSGLARDMSDGRLRRVTEALAVDLRAGHSLPEALARQPEIPPYYSNLVLAGVQTGRLPDVLVSLSNYAKMIVSTRAIIIDALLYPGIVLLLGFLVFGLLAVFIVPQFQAIFDSFGLNLPDITRFVIFIGSYFTIFFGVVASLFAVALILYLSSRAVRNKFIQTLDYIPLIGTVIRSARIAAFTDLLGLLVQYGMPLPAAFRMAGQASSDPRMTAGALKVEAKLMEGEPIGSAIRGVGLVPDWVAWMTAAGEGRGALGSSLREIATLYNRRVSSRSVVLRTLLGPLIVIGTAGFLVGGFAIALMLPMIKLLEGLSK